MYSIQKRLIFSGTVYDEKLSGSLASFKKKSCWFHTFSLYVLWLRSCATGSTFWKFSSSLDPLIYNFSRKQSNITIHFLKPVPWMESTTQPPITWRKHWVGQACWWRLIQGDSLPSFATRKEKSSLHQSACPLSRSLAWLSDLLYYKLFSFARYATVYTTSFFFIN